MIEKFFEGNFMKYLIDILMVSVLAVTALYVKRYWEEAVRLKKEMIEQNKLLRTSIVLTYRPRFTFIHEESDTYLKNIGTGPAINVTYREIPIEYNEEGHDIINVRHEDFIHFHAKDFHDIGVGDQARIGGRYRGDRRDFRVVISYEDIFGEKHESKKDGVNVYEDL